MTTFELTSMIPPQHHSLLVPTSLPSLPPEVLLLIFSYLEVYDLLQTSRTCRALRILACDPLLHLKRLHQASYTLSWALSRCPPKSSLSPPHARIYISKRYVIALQVQRSLMRNRVSRRLARRPSPVDLVERGILPSTCTTYSSPVSPALIQLQQRVQKRKLMDGLGKKLERRPSVNSLVSLNIIPAECVRQSVSPVIVATRRKVIREGLKDGLRAWVEGRGIQAQKKRADEFDMVERTTVKNLVRRFAAKKLAIELEEKVDLLSLEKKRAQSRWGRDVEIARIDDHRRESTGAGACLHPTRAHVLGLKKFWEGVIRAAS